MSDDIAGFTRRAPRATYEATLPGIGHVTLRREHTRYASLSLDLEPAFAASLPTGNGATQITLPGPRPTLRTTEAGDLRALLVQHHLLGRPELLRSATLALPGADDVALAARDALVQGLSVAACRPDGRHRHRCPQCPAPPAPPAPRSASRSFGYGYGYGYERPVLEDCAHVALFALAMNALMDAYPEITLELSGLITPDAYENPTRFVLSTGVMQPMLTSWLCPGEAHDPARRGYAGWRWESTYGRPHRKRPRAAAVQVDWEGVPPAQRAGLSFAARAWQCEADAPRFAHRPAGAVAVAPWQPTDTHATLDLAVLLPEEFRLPPAPPPRAPVAPRVAPAQPPAAPAKKKTPTKAATPKTPARAEASAPAALYTMKDLAALGHSAAAVKKMLKLGVIERESFGWYRFAKR